MIAYCGSAGAVQGGDGQVKVRRQVINGSKHRRGACVDLRLGHIAGQVGGVGVHFLLQGSQALGRILRLFAGGSQGQRRFQRTAVHLCFGRNHGFALKGDLLVRAPHIA